MSHPDQPETVSIALRVRRVTYEDAYVAVHVTQALTKIDENGERKLNFEAFFAEGLRISEDPRGEWKTESCITEPHPLQGPKPDDRQTLDSYYIGEA
ncbi:MAG: hypothetical protein ABWY06_17730 [Pseudomonas sp.]|uniref:hypothetical protein n=1 Tax=Pseudomonas sp. TaxID=306 RepID=UPI003393108B